MILHEELATVGQRMLWLVERHRGGAGRLNYPLFLRLRGPLDIDRLRLALDQLIVRHEALRTTFARRRGLLTQLVHAPEPVPVRMVALDAAADTDGRLAEALHGEATTSIDATASPVRATLWALGDLDHVLCLNVHHLVTDAWSSRVLTDELVQLLSNDALPKVIWQYRHVARWQRRPTTIAQWREDEQYWSRQLSGVTPLGPWDADPRATSSAADGNAASGDTNGTVQLDLENDLGQRIERLARTQRATPFGVLLALFYLALRAEVGRSDLCVAAPFANRTRPESAGTVGLLANLVMLRTRVPGDESFSDHLARTRDTVSAAVAHQGYPYYLLAPADGLRRDLLDEVVFQMLPELPQPRRAGALEVEVLVPQLPSRFDIELAAIPHPGGLRVRLQYARHRVPDATAGRLAAAYRQAVTQALT